MKKKSLRPAKVDSADTGFACDAIFFNKILFEGIAPGNVPATEPADTLAIGWDWAWLARNVFDVNLTINISPSSLRPENISLTAIGRFSIRGEATSVSVEQFAQFSAPAILMPYVRQHITALTSAGQVSPLVLPPLNVQAMMKRMNPKAATAATHARPKQLTK
jgi:preprotein translocase subunit SecB